MMVSAVDEGRFRPDRLLDDLSLCLDVMYVKSKYADRRTRRGLREPHVQRVISDNLDQA